MTTVGTAELNYQRVIANPDGTPTNLFITQWNSLRSDVGKAMDAAAASVAGSYQPLDTDLTAISLLATTGYGRGALTLADSAAALTYFGAQPAGSYQPLGSYVRYDAQTLTTPQQAQARTNIGAGTGSGSVTSVGLTSTTLTVTGSPVTGSGVITVNLPTTAVAAGSYGSATQVGTFTVDAFGRLTAAGNTTVTPAWTSITGTPTTLAGYGITDAVSSTTVRVANLVLAGPASGASAAPTWRFLVQADIPPNSAVGDVTAPSSVAGVLTTTLATVNSNVGTFGDASHVAQATFDAKGRATAVVSVLITPGAIGAEQTANKGVANGYCGLDANVRVPRANRDTNIQVYTAANRTVSAAEPYDLILFNRATAGAVAVTLPTATALSAVSDGYKISFGDGKGDAATNNINFTAGTGTTILGGATKSINTNYAVLTMQYSQTLAMWMIV